MHPGTEIGPRGLPLSYKVRDIVVAPGLVLAPMEGVTDLSFRRLVRAAGGVGMTWTEFIPSGGLSRGEARWQAMAEIDPDERPVAIQIYGREPALMAEAGRMVQDMGASIVDINMGCPSKKVCAHSGGSALMKEPALVAAIVRAVRAVVTVPLTVKTRSGFDPSHRNAPDIAWICQEEGAEALTVHWRTRADLYGGVRQVDTIAQVVQRLSIPVLGNGDIVDAASAEAMLRETGCDGLMIGRGAMKNPWIFRQLGAWLRGEEIPPVTLADRHHALLAYLAECQRQLSRPDLGRGRQTSPDKAVLGRLKQLSKHFLDGLPLPAKQGESLRQQVLHSQSISEAVARIEAGFAGTA